MLFSIILSTYVHLHLKWFWIEKIVWEFTVMRMLCGCKYIVRKFADVFLMNISLTFSPMNYSCAKKKQHKDNKRDCFGA